jgi:hypothetical protein
MGIPAAAILSGALIVATIILAISLRWEIAVGGVGTGFVYRLDRWTGDVVQCDTLVVNPAKIDCEAK